MKMNAVLFIASAADAFASSPRRRRKRRTKRARRIRRRGIGGGHYMCVYVCVRKPNIYNNGEMCKTYLKLLRISRLKKEQPNAFFSKNEKKKKKFEIKRVKYFLRCF